MIILAVVGLYKLISVEDILTWELLKTKINEKIRLAIVETDQDAAIPSSPHLIPKTKEIIIDKFVKSPHNKYRLS